jgi:hypothetical protein
MNLDGKVDDNENCSQRQGRPTGEMITIATGFSERTLPAQMAPADQDIR